MTTAQTEALRREQQRDLARALAFTCAPTIDRRPCGYHKPSLFRRVAAHVPLLTVLASLGLLAAVLR